MNFFKDVKKTDLENTFERKESDCLSNKKDEKIHKENKDRSYSPTLEKNLRKGESKKKRIKKVGKNQDKESLYAHTNTSNLFSDVEKNREEELVDDDFKLTCKSNEKKPFCPMTHLNGGCKIDIPVSISNECPKDAERKAEVNKEIADSLHSPSVIEESLNVETLFPNNVLVEDSNYGNNFTFLAQPEDTLKYKENKKVEDLNDENPENFNQLMKQTKRIDSKNDAVISKTRPNLLSENDNELLETNLKSSNNIESQKICDKAQNRASTSSKETDYSETSSKFQRKKVRLYNLESAPVFDVPRISSSFDASQENAPCKSNLPEPDKGYISENSDKPFELRNKRKTESDGKKNCAERKRRKSSDHNELLTRGHSIHLFDDFPVSEEDFQEHTFRDSYRRKRNISETLSAVHEQSVTRNREDEVFLNTEEKKPAKKQRKAALKAMKKTKEILDKKPEATHTLSVYDIVEDIDQTKKNSASTSKSLKRKQSKSDTDTHSSDVSWLKKRKSYLFESPKKNYSDWRKSVSKKKKLPVKVIPDTSVRKIADSKSSRKRKKEGSKSDSNIDAKSFGFSALETYDLTVEKNDIINSHSVMKDLESQFCDIAKANVTEKSSAVNGLDSITEIDHSRKKFKNNCEISSTEKKKKDASTSKVLNTENKYYDPENEFNNEPEYDMIEHDNNGNTYENIAPSIELIECFEEENAVECEETKSKHTLKDVSQELVYRHPIDELAMSETRGKIMILQRFLKSVAEYSGKYKSKDSCKSSLHETISSSDLCPPHLSCKTFSDGIEIAKSNDENQVVLDSNLSEQCPNEEIIDNLEESENIVNEYEQSPVFSPRRRKKSSSEDFDKAQCLSFNHQVSEKETSMEPRTNDRNGRATSMEARTASDDLSIHDQKRRKHLDKKIRKYLSGSENSSSKQEKFSKKSKPQKRSTKDIRNRSFSSSVSHLTSTSMKDALKDKNWLQDITSLLSQNACNLSRKMLATVQICFAEFCFKMSTLRENLVKTAKIFELPLSQDEYKLKSLIKSCKIVRLEVEKSLVRMRSTGKEYFEAEERDYKRLRKKQMKANKKYLQNMQKIKRNSIAKLEQKVLYKSKYFLKKFLMHIDSA